tara:strand:- start:4437 stop:4961 length:525 start_codon:yes stop_codon:yes gene_type:complete
MIQSLQGAIPGQSLTDEPKNFPWERPPQITDPDEAIRYHIDRISDEEVIDNIFFALDFGVPAKNLSDSIMTGAVAKGIHTIDISLIAEPIVRKFIMKAADKAGVKYQETFEEPKVDPMERAAMLVAANKATPQDQQDKGYALLKESEEAVTAEAMPQEEPVVEEEVKPKGLMAR